MRETFEAYRPLFAEVKEKIVSMCQHIDSPYLNWGELQFIKNDLKTLIRILKDERKKIKGRIDGGMLNG